MPTTHRIRIPRAQDRVVLECFRQLLEISEPKPSSQKFSMRVLGYDQDISVDLKNFNEIVETLSSRGAFSTIFQIQLDFISNSFQVRYNRGGEEQSPSAHYDTVVFYAPDRRNDKPEVTYQFATQAVGIVVGALDAFPGSFSVRSNISQSTEDGSSLALYRETIRGITETGLSFSRSLADLEVRLEERWHHKDQQLEQRAAAERAKLDEERQTTLGELAEREKKLEERIKDIDLREPRYLRRENIKNLVDDIKERAKDFSLTQTTRSLRIPALCAFLGFFVFAAFGTAWLGWAPLLSATWSSMDGWPLAFIAIKGVGLTILTAAIGFAFLRWQINWADRHADAEFRLRQVQIDIQRAAWLVETALEWELDKGRSMPIELIERLGNNLFAIDQTKQDSERSPADELASALLGTASNVRLKVGDHEISLDRKAVKQLAEKESPKN